MLRARTCKNEAGGGGGARVSRGGTCKVEESIGRREREKPKFSQQRPVQTKIVPIKDYHPVLEEKPLEFNPRTAPIKDWTADKLMAFLNTRLSKPQMILRSGSPNWWQLKTRWLEVWVRNRTSFYANGEQMRKGKPQRSGCQGPCTSRSPRPAVSQGRV